MSLRKYKRDSYSGALILADTRAAEEFIEKEISLSLRGRLRLIWDLVVGKKINISKY